jgi:hypothetical protein
LEVLRSSLQQVRNYSLSPQVLIVNCNSVSNYAWHLLGAAGSIGYTGKGIYKAFQKEHKSGVTEYVMAARVAEGLLDLQAATAEEGEMILDMWGKAVNVVDVDTKATRKEKNKERRRKSQIQK